MRTIRRPQAPALRRPLSPLPPGARRRRPRDYLEWRTLYRWGRIPAWEESPPGYLLREARERVGLSQAALAVRLGCSQQAVARAERGDSNPTVDLLRRWSAATGLELLISFEAPARCDPDR